MNEILTGQPVHQEEGEENEERHAEVQKELAHSENGTSEAIEH